MPGVCCKQGTSVTTCIMKLLLDQNISFRLVSKIAEFFPETAQVKELGLINATDIEIWEFAKKNGFTIVTFDADFFELSTLLGFPPKIIWLRTGNTRTEDLALLIQKHSNSLHSFLLENEHGCLEINE